MEQENKKEKVEGKKQDNSIAEKILDPREQMMRFSRGKLILEKPIHDGSDRTVTEIKWDFAALTGEEYVEAMDRDQNANNAFRITRKQAFELFAAAAGKCGNGIDATDIRKRMGIADAQKAAQVATIFSTLPAWRETNVSA